MDRVLFLLCCAVLAGAPAQGQDRDVPRQKAVGKDDRVRPAPPLREREQASTGASAPERRGGTDLGFEAEKEEEEFLKKKRTAPLKGR